MGAATRPEETLRICHVIESANAGSAAIMMALAIDAVGRGHEVHVVYSPAREDPAITGALRRAGCASVREAPMRRAIGPWDARDGLNLRKVLKSLGRIDVIHSHSSKAGALARTFGRFPRTAQVYSPHGFYTMTGEAGFYVGPVERALSHLTDRIIAVSDYERQHAIDLGIAAQRVAVVPNGIAPFAPMPRAEARTALGLAADDFVVGFVGRLAAQKNPLDALDAIAACTSSPSPRLVMIGDGDLRGAVEARAAMLGQRAILLGVREAKPLLSAFDVLLCTSRYEGMAVTFLEAIHCGLPIVSYPVGGAAELVHDGKTGFVTDPRPAAAAIAIDTIARMAKADRVRMSELCRALAARHTDTVMGAETMAVYESVRKR